MKNQLPIFARWSIATILGYAFGIAISAYAVGRIARPLSPFLWGIPNVLLFGAIIGIFLGLAQLVMLPKRVSLQRWLLFTLGGCAIGFAIGSLVGEFLGNAISPTGNIVIGGAAIQMTTGGTIGLAIGYAQWQALAPHLQKKNTWMLASMLGAALGYGAAVALLELFDIPLLKKVTPLSFGAILGLFVGIFQGWVLRSDLKAG